MTLSVAIQTHDARAEMAAGLNECLAGTAELVFDPSPGGPPNPWRTYRTALERTPEGADRLIVQDDVLVCDYFLEAVDAARAAKPDRVLIFFVAGHPLQHRRTVTYALERSLPWAELDLSTWIPVVSVLWPARLIPRILAWTAEQFGSRRFPPAFTADDEICGQFLRAIVEPPLATVPSLVEHPDTAPSLVHGARRNADGRDPGRRAAYWIGDDGCDPRGIDWTLDPWVAGRSPFTA